MTLETAPARLIPEPTRKTYLSIHSFQALNTISFTIALGTPLTLFARELGASATILGLISALTPLFALLQLPMAGYAARVGYRTLMMRGWGGRVVTLVLLCLLPLAQPLLPKGVAISVLVASLLLFNLLRGFAAGSMAPWTAALVPRPSRARFITRDRTFTTGASILALVVSGVILSGEHTALAYSGMFTLAFVAGVASLFFLNRVPAAPVATGVSGRPDLAVLPWRAVLSDRSFMTYVAFGFGIQFVMAAAAPFGVIFLKDEVRMPDGLIIQLTAIAQAVGTLALWFGRSRIDEKGSKLFMKMALGWWVAYFLIWMTMASRSVAGLFALAPIVIIVNGAAGGIYDLASTRLMMNMGGDRDGSAQYFAMFQTCVSLAAGTSPILWGVVLDTLGTGDPTRFVLFYAIEAALLALLGLFVLRRVRER